MTCFTLFWPVFRNLLGNLQLKLQVVAVHRPADTESVLSTHIYKHSKHLCVPSGITAFQSYRDTEVISGLEYVNLGLKSHKIHNWFSWWAKRGAIITHSLESQQCPNTSPHPRFKLSAIPLCIIPEKTHYTINWTTPRCFLSLSSHFWPPLHVVLTESSKHRWW